MYLRKAIYENVGPLETVYFDFPFDINGLPKPVVLVGENGSENLQCCQILWMHYMRWLGKSF